MIKAAAIDINFSWDRDPSTLRNQLNHNFHNKCNRGLIDGEWYNCCDTLQKAIWEETVKLATKSYFCLLCATGYTKVETLLTHAQTKHARGGNILEELPEVPRETPKEKLERENKELKEKMAKMAIVLSTVQNMPLTEEGDAWVSNFAGRIVIQNPQIMTDARSYVGIPEEIP